MFKDRSLTLAQFRVKVAVVINHGLRDFGKKRLVESNLGTAARRTTDDHTRNVISSTIARDDAIRNEECSRPNMITDNTIRREVLKHFLFAVTCEASQNFQRPGKEIGLVVGVH